ncbi:anthranilate phosphoribosyltransferase [Euryarchaeota archaeon 13_1_20CM_4_64_14]|nr:MAG: anthranilate phosphoribosyltransferase [Euryarchaeota archaeon 13_1_20CM_4_64_14]
MIQDAIRDLATGASLGFERAHDAMAEIMDAQATPAQIGAFLMGLRMKGEGPDEIAGMATAMRERCVRIRSRADGRVVDLCGTGGARVTTFNVSTLAMFVVAAAGVRVAKHGNRAITSPCGSADLLEALGARVDLEPAKVERILDAHGLCFMFAPKFHPAMQHVIGPRRELGVRTVFNILGPLTNPAGAKGHLLGVFSPDLVPLMSKVSARLGIEHALVVHGQAGMDEICDCGEGGRADSTRRTWAETRDAPGERGCRNLRFGKGGISPGSAAPGGGGPRLREGVRNLAHVREGHWRKFVEGGRRWTLLSASSPMPRPFSRRATMTCEAKQTEVPLSWTP